MILDQEDEETYRHILALLGSVSGYELGLTYLGLNGASPLPAAQRARLKDKIQLDFTELSFAAMGNFHWWKLFGLGRIHLSGKPKFNGTLPDISAFGNLRDLFLTHYPVATLPKLPSGLKDLYLQHNDLREITELPSGLVKFECSYNSLRLLPELPKGLETLHLKNNFITHLPDTLPSGLRILTIDNNKIAKLPLTLPHTLEYIFARNNPLLTDAEKERVISLLPDCEIHFDYQLD